MINNNTPICTLSVGQLIEVLKDNFSLPVVSRAISKKNYVYGLRGIQELFHVSHKTAQIYKDGMLKPAVYQTGKKIIVDADMAMQIFRANNGNIE